MRTLFMRSFDSMRKLLKCAKLDRTRRPFQAMGFAKQRLERFGNVLLIAIATFEAQQQLVQGTHTFLELDTERDSELLPTRIYADHMRALSDVILGYGLLQPSGKRR